MAAPTSQAPFGGIIVGMTASDPSPIIARHVEKDGELLYVVLERVNESDVDGELFRLRAHRHPPGSARTATWSNAIVREETGNKYVMRIAFIKFLLEKRDDGWKTVGASSLSSLPESEFWRLDL